jgi:hypothetical protein
MDPGVTVAAAGVPLTLAGVAGAAAAGRGALSLGGVGGASVLMLLEGASGRTAAFPGCEVTGLGGVESTCLP